MKQDLNKLCLAIACVSFLTACSEDEGCIDLLVVARTNESAPTEQEVDYSSTYEDGVTTIRMEWMPQGSRLQDVELGMKVPSTLIEPCGPYTMKRTNLLYQVFDHNARLVFEGGRLSTAASTTAYSGEYIGRTGPVCEEAQGSDDRIDRSDAVEHNGQTVLPGESISVDVDGRDYRLYNLGKNSWVALIPGEWAATCE